MRKLLVGLVAVGLVVAFSVPAGAGGGKGELAVGTNLPAPGFWNGDTVDDITGGFEYGLAQEIADSLGYSGVKVVGISFDALVAGQAKGFDFALSQVSITPERKQVLAFSKPYYRSDNGIMIKKGSGVEIDDKKSAKAAQWGVQTATTQLDFLKEKIKPNDDPRVYQETSQAFAALQAGQIDAVLLDTSILLAQAGQAGSEFEVIGQFKTSTGLLGAVFPKGSKASSKLRKQVNKVITKLDKNGRLDELNEEFLVPEFGGDPNAVPYIKL